GGEESPGGPRLAVKVLLRLQTHEGATKRLIVHRVGEVGANALRQQEIVEADLQAPQRVLAGNVVDRSVAQNRKVRWYAHELARVGVDPYAEHALLASRTKCLRRATHGNHEIVGRAERTSGGLGLDGAKQYQLFADEVGRYRDAMVGERDDQPFSAGRLRPQSHDGKREVDQETAHHPPAT